MESVLDAPAVNAEASFRYVHSHQFTELLEAMEATLLVSTYQAGKLVAFRARQGRMSMLLRTFDKAMGVAADADRMAVGTNYQIWILRNSPLVARKLEPNRLHDACYLPRSSHVTGSIDCHEIAWGRGSVDRRYRAEDDGLKRSSDELWIVNTLFSCLCTLDEDYSFVPRWRPRFVSRLTRHDRCHLNGLAIVDGRPKYVTAFGETDTPEGWRENKREGGCVIDVDSGETLARGLCMPHSPRVHDGRLWLLDSGKGRLVVVDPDGGHVETIAELPGYTRGLAFCGRHAFVGLSKIRETAVFGGVPIAERLDERTCGVSVIDTVTGQTVAFLEFEDGVEEIFDVQLVRNVRYPAIVGFSKDTIRRACVIGPERPISFSH